MRDASCEEFEMLDWDTSHIGLTENDNLLGFGCLYTEAHVHRSSTCTAGSANRRIRGTARLAAGLQWNNQLKAAVNHPIPWRE